MVLPLVAEVDVAIKLVNDQNSSSKFNLETHFNSNPVIQSDCCDTMT